jgi:hypothetical protein
VVVVVVVVVHESARVPSGAPAGATTISGDISGVPCEPPARGDGFLGDIMTRGVNTNLGGREFDVAFAATGLVVVGDVSIGATGAG